MKKEAIFHVNLEEFIYPVSRKELVIRLRTAKQDFKKCRVIYWDRTSPNNKKNVEMVCKQRDELFDYFALGHIHKPQILTPHVRYSGSPIALSFSERKDNKVVILLEIEEKEIKQTSIPVPKIRDLVKFTGNLTEVIAKVESYQPQCKLQAFIELDVIEENENPSKLLEMKTFEADYKSDAVKIIKSRLSFASQNITASKFTSGITIAELSPKDVFRKKVESTSMAEADKEMVYLAFDELLEQVLNPEQL